MGSFTETWVQEKYILLLSPSLTKFSKSEDHLYNFRCPFCKDSKSKKAKKSAYMYPHKENRGYMFHCHHCPDGSKTKSFDTFMNEMNHSLYMEYKKEVLSEKYFDKEKPEKKKVTSYLYGVKHSRLDELKKISSLAPTHVAAKYIRKRKIPSYKHFLLFYCPDFTKWVNSMLPGKLSENVKEERIIIPLFDQNKDMFGFQGRALNPYVEDHLRYITIILDKDKPSVYGLSEVDFSKTHYIFEGPFDAMFIMNSIAMLGSSKVLDINKDKGVFCFDNEPRKLEIVQTIHKKIANGYKVFIWPKEFADYKDINDLMVATDMSVTDLKSMVDENTFQGLAAELAFANWKKIDIGTMKAKKDRTSWVKKT